MKDWFAAAFGAVVADVRREVVERGVYGRPVTSPFAAPAKGGGDRSVAERLGWDQGPTKDRGVDLDR
jgi:hypothetical protein